MTDIAALLIDMDGTIVDTEPYWIASEHALVAEFGGSWSPEDAHSVVGFDLLDAAVELQTRGGVELEPTHWSWAPERSSPPPSVAPTTPLPPPPPNSGVRTSRAATKPVRNATVPIRHALTTTRERRVELQRRLL